MDNIKCKVVFVKMELSQANEVLTNTLKNKYFCRKVPSNYYGKFDFDMNWELIFKK